VDRNGSAARRGGAMDYLEDGTNFDGMEKQSQEEYDKHFRHRSVPCPACKGYGGWNLRLDAYGKGRHFQCGCSQCNGWGYVAEGSPDHLCLHTMKELSYEEARKRGINHYGRCYHVYECTKGCGTIRGYDSSD